MPTLIQSLSKDLKAARRKSLFLPLVLSLSKGGLRFDGRETEMSVPSVHPEPVECRADMWDNNRKAI